MLPECKCSHAFDYVRVQPIIYVGITYYRRWKIVMLTLIKQYNPSTIIDVGRCHTFHTYFIKIMYL